MESKVADVSVTMPLSFRVNSHPGILHGYFLLNLMFTNKTKTYIVIIAVKHKVILGFYFTMA